MGTDLLSIPCPIPNVSTNRRQQTCSPSGDQCTDDEWGHAALCLLQIFLRKCSLNWWNFPPHLLNLALITLCTDRSRVLPWVPFWVLHWQIYLLVSMRWDLLVADFVLLLYRVSMWILSVYAMMKLKWINFSPFSMAFIQLWGLCSRKSPILNWPFWMYWYSNTVFDLTV